MKVKGKQLLGIERENRTRYIKNSDCPICPTYEETRRPKDGLLVLLTSRGRSAPENANIWKLKIAQ